MAVMNEDVPEPAPEASRTSALMDPARSEFIEKMGIQVETTGWMPRMTGRVLGALLVSDEPVTQSELREMLLASLGAISGATRDLLAKRLAQRVNIPGSRQAGLQLHPDAWRILEEDGLRAVQDYLSLAAGGLLDIGNADTPSSQNLQRMRDYFAVVEERMLSVMAWLENTSPARTPKAAPTPQRHLPE